MREMLTIRRISVLVLLFLVSACITSIAALLVATLVGLDAFDDVSVSVAKAHQVASAFFFFATTVASWFLIKSWPRRIDREELPWFLRLRPRSTGAVLLLGVIVLALIPMPILGNDVADTDSLFAVNLLLKLAALVALPMIWFWWCERPPGEGNPLPTVALIWVLLSVLPWSEWHWVYFDLAPTANEVHAYFLGSWTIAGETRSLGLSLRPLDLTPGQWLTSLVVSVALCAASFAIYRFISALTD